MYVNDICEEEKREMYEQKYVRGKSWGVNTKLDLSGLLVKSREHEKKRNLLLPLA